MQPAAKSTNCEKPGSGEMAGLPTLTKCAPPRSRFNLAVMARILCTLVLCWCLARESAADTPARVRELNSDTLPWQQVRSEDYAVQGSSGLEWLSAVTAQRGFKVPQLSPQCLEDMELYWSGLENGTAWASRSKG